MNVMTGVEAHIPPSVADVIAKVNSTGWEPWNRLDEAVAAARAARTRATAHITLTDRPAAADNRHPVRTRRSRICDIAIVQPALVFLAGRAVREVVEIHALGDVTARAGAAGADGLGRHRWRYQEQAHDATYGEQ